MSGLEHSMEYPKWLYKDGEAIIVPDAAAHAAYPNWKENPHGMQEDAGEKTPEEVTPKRRGRPRKE